MDLGLISVIAAVLQLGAALFSLMLMRLTGFRLAWLLISTAFFLMAIRRSLFITGVSSWAFGALTPPALLDHLVVLTITVLMLAGVF
jgi:hypothetical protein